MAPKKKGAKKQQDDWEADLGESIDPVAQAETAAQNGEADQTKPAAEADAEGESGGGGLLAALKRNKNKRQKKGKPENDFVEGEDPTTNADQPSEEVVDLSAKAPEEGTIDDEDFPSAGKKGKGGKKPAAQALKGDDSDDDSVASGAAGMKSKKEKEKEKKEREKQRKKEQVSNFVTLTGSRLIDLCRLSRKRPRHQHRRLKQSQRNQRLKKRL